jgi:hypothetical protein
MNVNYHVLNNSIVVSFNGEHHSIAKDDSRYSTVLNAIRTNQLDDIPNLVNTSKHLSGINGVEVRAGLVYLNGKPVSDAISEKIIRFKTDNLPFDYLIKFAEKLELNPSFNSKQMLYKFLEHNGHPITKNGNFIAYRGVTVDFKDVHTRKFDNSVGSVCEMKRELVDDNPNNTCSHGLHVACHDYAKGFGSKTIEVEVDPRDVVCVPTDYNGTKMRVCKFKVVNVCNNIRNEEIYDDYSDEVDESWDEQSYNDCGVTRDIDGNDCESDCENTGESCAYTSDDLGNTGMLTRFSRKVDSSTINRIEYRDGKLTVSLNNGTKYRYSDVAECIANDFLNASSKGSYYAKNIKNEYEYVKL